MGVKEKLYIIVELEAEVYTDGTEKSREEAVDTYIMNNFNPTGMNVDSYCWSEEKGCLTYGNHMEGMY